MQTIMQSEDQWVVFATLIGVGVSHFLINYTKPPSFFTSVYLILGCNVVFLASACFAMGLCSHMLVKQAQFFFLQLFGFLITKAIYNVFIRHPGIPGPLLWKATDWSLWGAFQRGHAHLEIDDLHKQYGDMVRIQPNHISFSSMAAVEDIHGIHTKAVKGDSYGIFQAVKTVPRSLFSTTDTDSHSMIRKVMNPAFSPNSLKEFEPAVSEYVDQFVGALKILSERDGGLVNMDEWFFNLMLSITGYLTIGNDFNTLEVDGTRHWFIHSFHGFMGVLRTLWSVPWFDPVFHAIPALNKVDEHRQNAMQFLHKTIEMVAKEDFEGRKLLGAYLAKGMLPERGGTLTRRDFQANCTGLIVDTTGTALTFTLYHVLANQRVWKRLCDEVRSRFTSEEEITHTAVSLLPYLDAIIHEGIRLRPSLPSTLPRVTPPEGMTIAGKFIAGNTTVSTSFWRILHDEKNFSNPDSFIPERWLDSEKSGEMCNKLAWVPFSVGLRSCIGRSLAMMELKMVFTKFVWHFDARLAEEGQKEPEYEDNFMVKRGPLWIVVTPLKRDTKEV